MRPFLLASCLLALALGSASAQEDVGIARLTRATAAQERLNADLKTSAPRLEAEAIAEGERLGREEADPREGDVSLADLRQARFEADTRRTRLAATASRIGFFEDELAKLNAQIVPVQQASTEAPADLEALATNTRLDLLRGLQAATQTTVDLLRQSASRLDSRLALLSDRVTLLQSRLRLVPLDEDAELAGDPRAAALRAFVERSGRESIRLANEAAVLEPRSPGESLRKRQLELSADEAFLRSSLRAADLDLLGLERQLAYLDMVAAERDALPARIADQGLRQLAGLRERLAARTASLADVRRRLADQRALLPPATGAAATQVAAMRRTLTDVGDTVSGQDGAVAALARDLERIAADFDRRLAAAESEALLARSALPSGSGAWQRVGRSAARVPAQLAAAFAGAGREVAAVPVHSFETPICAYAAMGSWPI